MNPAAHLNDNGSGKAPVCYPGTNLPVLRFPRLPTDDDRILKLDAQVFQAIGRQDTGKIEAGRSLNELKRLLGHGNFTAHFEETFASSGLSLRTAERWMRKAAKADALGKNDKLSIFTPATDQNAKEIKDAAERAQEEVGHKKPKEASLYRLMLHLNTDEKAALDALRKSRYWDRAERHLVHRLQELCVHYDIVEKDAWKRS